MKQQLWWIAIIKAAVLISSYFVEAKAPVPPSNQDPDFIQLVLQSEQTFSLTQGEIAFFKYANPSKFTRIEFKVELFVGTLQKNLFDLSSFLLVVSTKSISNSQFLRNFVYASDDASTYIDTYEIQFVDLDGMATQSKTLSVRYSYEDSGQSEIATTLYFYLLGPYYFGQADTTVIPSTQNGSTHTIQGSYLLSSQFTCLNNCSNQGTCNMTIDSIPFCKCNDGYINRDCSVQATKLKVGQDETSITVQKNNSKYVYLDFTDSDIDENSGIIFSIKSNENSIAFYTGAEQAGCLYQVPDYFLWMEEQGYQYSILDVNNNKQEYSLLKSLVQKLISQNSQYIFMLVGLDEDTTFQVKFSSDSSSVAATTYVLYIVIGVVSFLIICYAIYYLLVRSKRQPSRPQRPESLSSQERAAEGAGGQEIVDIAVVEGQIHAGANGNEGRASRQQQRNNRPNQKLTLLQIDEHMPCKQFDDQTMYSEACAVCLEDFQSGVDKVRMTVCGHYFHDDCLQQWLKKQQNCPFCRQELTIEKIKEFKKNPIQYKPIQIIQVRSQPFELSEQSPQKNQNSQPSLADVVAPVNNRVNKQVTQPASPYKYR